MADAIPIESVGPLFFDLAYTQRHVIYVVPHDGASRADTYDLIFDVDPFGDATSANWPDFTRPKYYSYLPKMPVEAAMAWYVGLGGWEFSQIKAVYSLPIFDDQKINSEIYGLHFADLPGDQYMPVVGPALREYMRDHPGHRPIPEPATLAVLGLGYLLKGRRNHDRNHDTPDTPTHRRSSDPALPAWPLQEFHP